MQTWAVLEFAFALAVAIGIISLIIAELHIIERAEQQELWKGVREKIAKIG